MCTGSLPGVKWPERGDYHRPPSSSEVKEKSRAIYVEIKCQLDAIEVFIADIFACSTCFGHHYAHHQELLMMDIVVPETC